MKTIYFKMVAQKTTDNHTILIAVVPNDMLGENLPTICEMEAFKMPATIYTGTYPQIKINTDTITERSDLIGMGIDGIAMNAGWAIIEDNKKDLLGISIENSPTQPKEVIND